MQERLKTHKPSDRKNATVPDSSGLSALDELDAKIQKLKEEEGDMSAAAHVLQTARPLPFLAFFRVHSVQHSSANQNAIRRRHVKCRSCSLRPRPQSLWYHIQVVAEACVCSGEQPN